MAYLAAFSLSIYFPVDGLTHGYLKERTLMIHQFTLSASKNTEIHNRDFPNLHAFIVTHQGNYTNRRNFTGDK